MIFGTGAMLCIFHLKEHFAMILGLRKKEKIIAECLLAEIKMFK